MPISVAYFTSLTLIACSPAPSGKPTVIKTFSPTSDSVEVVWRPPDRSEMNGEFIGYRMSVRPRDKVTAEWTRIDLPGNVNESTVRQLGASSIDGGGEPFPPDSLQLSPGFVQNPRRDINPSHPVSFTTALSSAQTNRLFRRASHRRCATFVSVPRRTLRRNGIYRHWPRRRQTARKPTPVSGDRSPAPRRSPLWWLDSGERSFYRRARFGELAVNST